MSIRAIVTLRADDQRRSFEARLGSHDGKLITRLTAVPQLIVEVDAPTRRAMPFWPEVAEVHDDQNREPL